MAYDWKTEVPGVFSRHADNCPVREGGECTCGPLGYRASVREWDSNRRTVSPTFENIQEALAWQRDQMVRQDASRGLAAERGQLGALIDEFLQAAEDGMFRDGSGEAYTREGIRALRGALSYVDSELGAMDVQDVRRRHIQALVDQLLSSGVAPARVNAVAAALDSLYGYAVGRELVGFSPVVGLQLPKSENGHAYAVPPPAQPVAATDVRPEASTPWTTPPPGGGEAWASSTFPAESAAGDAQPPDPGYAGYPPGPPPGSSPTPPVSYATPPGAYPPPGPYTPPAYPLPPTPPPPTPPPYTPPPYTPAPYTPPGGLYPIPPGSYAAPPDAYPPAYPPHAQYPTPNQPPPEGRRSGIASAIFGDPGTAPDANYDATMQERWLWWTVRIIVIVFVLIALVLVAESV